MYYNKIDRGNIFRRCGEQSAWKYFWLHNFSFIHSAVCADVRSNNYEKGIFTFFVFVNVVFYKRIFCFFYQGYNDGLVEVRWSWVVVSCDKNAQKTNILAYFWLNLSIFCHFLVKESLKVSVKFVLVDPQ